MRSVLVSLLLFSGICLPVTTLRISIGAHLSENFPVPDTPQELIEAWLRFHEIDLCQNIDAVFVFSRTGLKVWCRVVDERSFQKLEQLLEPQRDSYQVELYATRPSEEEKTDKDRDPPPSLWQNNELRSYLGDASARAAQNLANQPSSMDFPPPDEMLKQRLKLYADQILEWNRKMKRYAMDLPAITHVALDPSASPALRLRARAVCMAHAQNLDKTLGRLESYLIHALPRGARENRSSSRSQSSVRAGNTAVDYAEQISFSAQNLVRRVYRFIHPEHYTVDLAELRQPSLLEAIKALEKKVSDFQRVLGRSTPK